MMDEVSSDSHSTDLSISGEEGHWTILLAHYRFWFEMRTKLFSNAGYIHPKIAQKCLEILLSLYKLHILAPDKEKF